MRGDQRQLPLIRRCTAGRHVGVRLLAHDEFAETRYGTLDSWCRACRASAEMERRGGPRAVPISRVGFAVVELYRRLGAREMFKRYGFGRKLVYGTLHGEKKYVERRTAERLLQALAQERGQLFEEAA